MPKILTDIDHIAIHPGEAGVSTVSVWFTEGRAQHEKITFSPFDLFDYGLFCVRVFEVTGHPFACADVEGAPDPWRAATRWRQLITSKLETASVEPQGRSHWKALID